MGEGHDLKFAATQCSGHIASLTMTDEGPHFSDTSWTDHLILVGKKIFYYSLTLMFWNTLCILKPVYIKTIKKIQDF